jgi:hypothetical protein
LTGNARRRTIPKGKIACDGDDLFVIRNGVKIAKRGEALIRKADNLVCHEKRMA